ncbi:MAG: hypothetical protein V4585_20960 [Bacteroidota bacterium]
MISPKYFYGTAIFLVFFLIVTIFIWGIDFPYMDQWEAVSFLEKSENHTLTFQDLVAQHNEHRILFPKLIMIFGASLTHWNIFFELYVNIFLGICLFWVIARSIKNLLISQEITNPFALIAIISLLVFSFSQYENWRWGWQIQIFLNVLMVCLGIYLLTKSTSSNLYFAGAVFAGVVATFSFANGLLFWGVGFVMLFLMSIEKNRKYVYFTIWAIFFTFLAWSYIGGYHRPEEHPIPVFTVEYILNYIAFVLSYLGNPIFESDANASLIFGIVGVLIYTIGWWKIYQNKNINLDHYAIFFYFSLYTLASAMLTALGRTGLGLPTAAASRYVTICNLFWINNFVILFTLLSKSFYFSKMWHKAVKSLTIILSLVILASHIVGFTMMIKFQKDMTEVRNHLLSGGENPEILKKTYPKPTVVLERDKILEKYKLSYRKQ